MTNQNLLTAHLVPSLNLPLATIMNNNDNISNDPILDWILQNDTNEDANKPMSNELLGFLLSQNVNTTNFVPQQQTEPQSQALHQQQQQQLPLPPPATKIHHASANNSSPSEEDDDPTDAQLKMMPSKERRQLRNKISARNFRNRRKEYMTSLETEMDQCKAENSQLKLEVKWVRGMMDKLQAENDRLRLELVICKQNLQPQHPPKTDTLESISTSDNNAINNFGYSKSNSNSVSPPTNTLQMLSNTNFLLNTPTATTSSDWDLTYPPTNITTTTSTITNSNTINTTPNSSSLSSCNNIYLAHASLPNWDMTSIFAKNHQNNMPSQKIDLIRTYPLLAPALMSIVLNHTLEMTTEDIMSSSKLYDPTTPYSPSGNTATDKFLLSSLSDTVVWKQMLQQQEKLQQVVTSDTNTDASQNSSTEEDLTDEELSAVARFQRDHCPFTWAQKQFCTFIIHYVVVKYPHLDTKARAYLPICDKYRQQARITQLIN